MAKLTEVEAHFRFGENWAVFSGQIGEPQIAQARNDLVRLLGRGRLDGLRFLDIGSGSGIHSLAALRMGAEVTAIDIDSDSVAATRALLTKFAPNARWTAGIRSIIDLAPDDFGRFDIVYSWGVLHHTGAMFDAIRRAAALVSANGIFCVALYARTRFCGLWRVEKRFYSRAPQAVQRVLRGCYIGAFWAAETARHAIHGRHYSFREYVKNYGQGRGMNFYTDVHDWLGGYPYESIAPGPMRSLMSGLGFAEQRSFVKEGRPGYFGSGCDEYVFARQTSSVSA